MQTRRSIAADYRAGRLQERFRLTPDQLEEAARLERPELDREALSRALRQYHQDLGTLDATSEALLERLAHPASRVVVTGQQAGLLGGPAYSVHKGAGAALLARQLDRPDAPVVGIYWIASQDHDADEVASTTLLDHAETLHRLTLDLPRGVPVGRIAWQPEWTRQVHELLDCFETQPVYREQVRARLNFALQGRSYADVFARLMHRLLGPAGLLVLDPLHPALAGLMKGALQRELTAPLEGPRRIEQAAAQLERLGYTPQLRRPEGATNLFLEREDGQRILLRQDQGSFEAEGERFSAGELSALLDGEPSRITPAAGLRPVIQDALLPTVAFVVGPGEIAYGAQLREVYPLHGLEQPLLWPRLSVTWLEPNVARMLGRFGLDAATFQQDPEAALGRALAREREAGAVSAEQLTRLAAEFQTLAGQLAALDPTLETAALRVQTRSLGQLARLQERAVRALARAEDDRSRQLTRLKLHLLPNGVPQEREMNFLTYLLKHGEEPLRRLLEQDPAASVELRLS
ncbi:bacillithiol biosynthesis cysteine-adding enzyme BshC [Deinococcus sonorensis]|uniref:Putative cysteine ligase BshC n=2 Tax=Deinococcus sonorensis TaxID=309891 RepID=A0AAU7UFG9_9DEIO